MSYRGLSGLLVAVMATLLAIALATGPGYGQGTSSAPGDKPAAAKSERSKPRGRLPAYFGSVVSEEQRTKIYEIQARFNEQIKKLQEEVATLMAERDGEVEGVLTPEQKEEIEQKRAEARARRQGAAEKSTSPKSTSSEEADKSDSSDDK